MTDSQGDGGYWSWLNVAKTQAMEFATKAQEFAETASKVAQEKATVLAKQAEEIRKNYDLEVAGSILLGTNTTTGDGKGVDIDKIKLTKLDLAKLDMSYITENMIAMAFPYELNQKRNVGDGEDSEGNDINIVAAYLRRKHQGRFMIWNLSEESYDYSKFSDQVLEHRFPGHPAPPLGLLFKICTSVESWLDADEKNVAVIHCLTGKGRTATVISCILTWLGEFDSPMQALQYVASRRETVVDHLTIPSQRRYIQYFSNMLDGIKPNPEALLLRRVIINTVPTFGTPPHLPDSNEQGCCPYIQLFKNGKLIATAAPFDESTHQENTNAGITGQGKMTLSWIVTSESSVSFKVDCPVQGDILLRCRHVTSTGSRVSMFRAAFHTGYITGGVLRLTKSQLDGTTGDDRYAEDFFIDLIFAPVTSTKGEVTVDGMTVVNDNIGLQLDAATADKYESSLHKDVRFWESVSARKIRSKKRRQRKFAADKHENFSILDDPRILLEETNHSSEINFYSTTSTVNTSHYDDLISQLALAESEATTELTFEQQENTHNNDSNSNNNNNDNDDDMDELAALESYVAQVANTTTTSTIPTTTAAAIAVTTNNENNENDDNNNTNNTNTNNNTNNTTNDNSALHQSQQISEPQLEQQAHADEDTEDNFTLVNKHDDTSTSTSSGVLLSPVSLHQEEQLEENKSKQSTEVKDSTSVLEDLEKELGLTDLNLFTHGATTGTHNPSNTSSSTSVLDDDDNLDELEKYLQSFTSK